MFTTSWWAWSFLTANLQSVLNWRRIRSERESVKFSRLTVLVIWPSMSLCCYSPAFASTRLGISNSTTPSAFTILMETNTLAWQILSRFWNIQISFIYFLIGQALRLLTQGQLSDEETEQVWRKVLEETDIDDDKKLSSNEFSHVINKSPDFLTTFNIRIWLLYLLEE